MLRVNDAATAKDFIFENPSMNKFARLVYCRENKVEQIKEYAKQNECIQNIRVNVDDLSILRKMEKGDLFIVDASHEHLMRGFDYRCKDGIALLLCCGFDSEEDLHQALGRVGRYGDVCVRLVDKELGEDRLKDESKRIDVAQQISAIIQKVKAEKEATAIAEKAAADLKQKQDAAAVKAAKSARALQA